MKALALFLEESSVIVERCWSPNKKFLIRLEEAVPGGYMTKVLSLEDFAASASVSQRTARRWLSEGRLPEAAYQLLRFKELGFLDGVGFKGYYVNQNALYTPTGLRFDRGDLDGTIYKAQEITALRNRVEELEGQLRVSDKAVDYWRSKAGVESSANDTSY